MYDDVDITKEYESKNYDILTEYAEGNMVQLKMALKNAGEDSQAGLRAMLRYEKSIMDFFFSNIKDEKEKAMYKLGMLAGVIDVYSEFVHDKIQEDRLKALYEGKEKSIDHLKEVIVLLDTFGVMNHKEVSKNLGIDDISISEVMESMRVAGLVQIYQIGSEKTYRLTDEGRMIGILLRRGV